MENEVTKLEQDDEKNATWEKNHQKIIEVVVKAMSFYRKSPPTISEISKVTGLSRQTVYSHLKDFSTHPAYEKRYEMLKMMEFDVVMGVCKYAISGDIRAARMYLEMIGKIQPNVKPMQSISGDTNIQINGMTINQRILQNLTNEQLTKIEEIIKTPVPLAEKLDKT